MLITLWLKWQRDYSFSAQCPWYSCKLLISFTHSTNTSHLKVFPSNSLISLKCAFLKAVFILVFFVHSVRVMKLQCFVHPYPRYVLIWRTQNSFLLVEKMCRFSPLWMSYSFVTSGKNLQSSQGLAMSLFLFVIKISSDNYSFKGFKGSKWHYLLWFTLAWNFSVGDFSVASSIFCSILLLEHLYFIFFFSF